eukprot:gnl/TRDRNA2_/TRDRNA2_128466_c0_seq1.p1 gnl/TRDRNA2_/TRDRNA2_128466_c0~~gnl/TRDRNA2_/TRDRNA2_128466_c0_seq1.p1  ORF type:complete len:336 (+),score=62.15 gnl/TRDRNA2_/TRDRNA2_128466_c0_seq1:125-1009(+)
MDGARMDLVTVGVHVELNTPQARVDGLDSSSWPATSLHLLSGDQTTYDVEAFRKRLALAFAADLRRFFVHGFADFKERINSVEALIGKDISLRVSEGTGPKTVIDGTYVGVNDSGHLQIRRKDGKDNNMDEYATIRSIKNDLMAIRGVAHPYLVSLRETDKYDFQSLLVDTFPSLKGMSEASMGGSWDGAWALPEVYSEIVSAIQGQWYDNVGTVYTIQGTHVHVSTFIGEVSTGCGPANAAVTLVEDDNGALWWMGRWSLNPEQAKLGARKGELRWAPSDLRMYKPMVWRWRA